MKKRKTDASRGMGETTAVLKKASGIRLLHRTHRARPCRIAKVRMPMMLEDEDAAARVCFLQDRTAANAWVERL
jgi:hypothetical protein